MPKITLSPDQSEWLFHRSRQKLMEQLDAQKDVHVRQQIGQVLKAMDTDRDNGDLAGAATKAVRVLRTGLHDTSIMTDVMNMQRGYAHTRVTNEQGQLTGYDRPGSQLAQDTDMLPESNITSRFSIKHPLEATGTALRAVGQAWTNTGADPEHMKRARDYQTQVAQQRKEAMQQNPELFSPFQRQSVEHLQNIAGGAHNERYTGTGEEGFLEGALRAGESVVGKTIDPFAHMVGIRGQSFQRTRNEQTPREELLSETASQLLMAKAFGKLGEYVVNPALKLMFPQMMNKMAAIRMGAQAAGVRLEEQAAQAQSAVAQQLLRESAAGAKAAGSIAGGFPAGAALAVPGAAVNVAQHITSNEPLHPEEWAYNLATNALFPAGEGGFKSTLGRVPFIGKRMFPPEEGALGKGAPPPPKPTEPTGPQVPPPPEMGGQEVAEALTKLAPFRAVKTGEQHNAAYRFEYTPIEGMPSQEELARGEKPYGEVFQGKEAYTGKELPKNTVLLPDITNDQVRKAYIDELRKKIVGNTATPLERQLNATLTLYDEHVSPKDPRIPGIPAAMVADPSLWATQPAIVKHLQDASLDVNADGSPTEMAKVAMRHLILMQSRLRAQKGAAKGGAAPVGAKATTPSGAPHASRAYKFPDEARIKISDNLWAKVFDRELKPLWDDKAALETKLKEADAILATKEKGQKGILIRKENDLTSGGYAKNVLFKHAIETRLAEIAKGGEAPTAAAPGGVTDLGATEPMPKETPKGEQTTRSNPHRTAPDLEKPIAAAEKAIEQLMAENGKIGSDTIEAFDNARRAFFDEVSSRLGPDPTDAQITAFFGNSPRMSNFRDRVHELETKITNWPHANVQTAPPTAPETQVINPEDVFARHRELYGTGRVKLLPGEDTAASLDARIEAAKARVPEASSERTPLTAEQRDTVHKMSDPSFSSDEEFDAFIRGKDVSQEQLIELAAQLQETLRDVGDYAAGVSVPGKVVGTPEAELTRRLVAARLQREVGSAEADVTFENPTVQKILKELADDGVDVRLMSQGMRSLINQKTNFIAKPGIVERLVKVDTTATVGDVLNDFLGDKQKVKPLMQALMSAASRETKVGNDPSRIGYTDVPKVIEWLRGERAKGMYPEASTLADSLQQRYDRITAQYDSLNDAFMSRYGEGEEPLTATPAAAAQPWRRRAGPYSVEPAQRDVTNVKFNLRDVFGANPRTQAQLRGAREQVRVLDALIGKYRRAQVNLRQRPNLRAKMLQLEKMRRDFASRVIELGLQGRKESAEAYVAARKFLNSDTASAKQIMEADELASYLGKAAPGEAGVAERRMGVKFSDYMDAYVARTWGPGARLTQVNGRFVVDIPGTKALQETTRSRLSQVRDRILAGTWGPERQTSSIYLPDRALTLKDVQEHIPSMLGAEFQIQTPQGRKTFRFPESGVSFDPQTQALKVRAADGQQYEFPLDQVIGRKFTHYRSTLAEKLTPAQLETIVGEIATTSYEKKGKIDPKSESQLKAYISSLSNRQLSALHNYLDTTTRRDVVGRVGLEKSTSQQFAAARQLIADELIGRAKNERTQTDTPIPERDTPRRREEHRRLVIATAEGRLGDVPEPEFAEPSPQTGTADAISRAYTAWKEAHGGQEPDTAAWRSIMNSADTLAGGKNTKGEIYLGQEGDVPLPEEAGVSNTQVMQRAEAGETDIYGQGRKAEEGEQLSEGERLQVAAQIKSSRQEMRQGKLEPDLLKLRLESVLESMHEGGELTPVQRTRLHEGLAIIRNIDRGEPVSDRDKILANRIDQTFASAGYEKATTGTPYLTRVRQHLAQSAARAKVAGTSEANMNKSPEYYPARLIEVINQLTNTKGGKLVSEGPVREALAAYRATRDHLNRGGTLTSGQRYSLDKIISRVETLVRESGGDPTSRLPEYEYPPSPGRTVYPVASTTAGVKTIRLRRRTYKYKTNTLAQTVMEHVARKYADLDTPAGLRRAGLRKEEAEGAKERVDKALKTIEMTQTVTGAVDPHEAPKLARAIRRAYETLGLDDWTDEGIARSRGRKGRAPAVTARVRSFVDLFDPITPKHARLTQLPPSKPEAAEAAPGKIDAHKVSVAFMTKEGAVSPGMAKVYVGNKFYDVSLTDLETKHSYLKAAADRVVFNIHDVLSPKAGGKGTYTYDMGKVSKLVDTEALRRVFDDRAAELAKSERARKIMEQTERELMDLEKTRTKEERERTEDDEDLDYDEDYETGEEEGTPALPDDAYEITEL